MLRRLHPEQPDSFEFTPANLEWAKVQMTKFPEGRQQSAVIPILWRAQEQEGWISRPAIEYVADLLGMADIRVLEVATFYYMFQLQPVGSVAHIQICGTTTCMICNAEDLIRVCREKIAPNPHELSADGRFSWEEVECLGACANAPMAQIGKDYYEDLTAEKLSDLLDAFAAGKVPVPGPQVARYASEPQGGLTSLEHHHPANDPNNTSVARAVELKETIKRIDGTEVPILAKWGDARAKATPPNEDAPEQKARAEAASRKAEAKGADKAAKADEKKVPEQGGANVANEKAPAKADMPKAAAVDAPVGEKAEPPAKAPGGVDGGKTAPAPAKSGAAGDAAGAVASDAEGDSPQGRRPEGLDSPRDGTADDLKMIKGVGPKLEKLLNSLGFWHFDQIAGWGAEELAWVDANLEGFKGRASRDEWIAQARALASGKETEFSRRAKRDDIYK